MNSVAIEAFSAHSAKQPNSTHFVALKVIIFVLFQRDSFQRLTSNSTNFEMLTILQISHHDLPG